MLADKRGFTLIEMLVVIAIVAAIAFIAVGATGSVFKKNQLAVEADQLTSTLRLAQSRSVSGYQDGTWGVSISSGSFTLFRGDSYATRDTAYDQVFNFSDAVTASGLSEVVFQFRSGETSDTGTITIADAASDDEKTITINSAGRITDL